MKQQEGVIKIVQYLADQGAEIKPNLLGRNPDEVATDPEIKLFLEVLPEAREAMRFAHLVFNDPSDIKPQNHKAIANCDDELGKLKANCRPFMDAMKETFPNTMLSGRLNYSPDVLAQFETISSGVETVLRAVIGIQKSIDLNVRNATCGATTSAGKLFMLSYTSLPQKFQITDIKLFTESGGHQFAIITPKKVDNEGKSANLENTVLSFRKEPFFCFDPFSKELKMGSQIPRGASANAVKNTKLEPVGYSSHDLGVSFKVAAANLSLGKADFAINSRGKDQKPKTLEAEVFFEAFQSLLSKSVTALTPFVKQLQEQRFTQKS